MVVEEGRDRGSRGGLSDASVYERALVFLRLAGEGDDPLAIAEQFAKRGRVVLVEGPNEVKVGELAAVTATAKETGFGKRPRIALTWIAHQGIVYQVFGISDPDRFADYRVHFDAVAQSFRPLAPEDRRRVREARLRLVTARSGEGLEDLLARSGSRWRAEEAAVANGLSPDAALERDQLLKIAVEERYLPDVGAR